MPSPMLEKMEALRLEAHAALQATTEFREFSAIDAAIRSMGGEAAALGSVERRVTAPVINKAAIAYSNGHSARRVSQGDAAALVLEEYGPATAADLLLLVPEKGGTVGGEKPLVNLTSTLSKDARFKSIRHGGSYLWWFENRPLPENWNTGAGLDLGEEPAPVSVSSSLEGGDGHDPATT